MPPSSTLTVRNIFSAVLTTASLSKEVDTWKQHVQDTYTLVSQNQDCIPSHVMAEFMSILNLYAISAKAYETSLEHKFSSQFQWAGTSGRLSKELIEHAQRVCTHGTRAASSGRVALLQSKMNLDGKNSQSNFDDSLGCTGALTRLPLELDVESLSCRVLTDSLPLSEPANVEFETGTEDHNLQALSMESVLLELNTAFQSQESMYTNTPGFHDPQAPLNAEYSEPSEQPEALAQSEIPNRLPDADSAEPDGVMNNLHPSINIDSFTKAGNDWEALTRLQDTLPGHLDHKYFNS